MSPAEPAEWQADQAPRLRPETYPGAWPTSSILLAGDRHFPLHLRRGRRLGRARLLHREHLPGEEVVSEPELSLDDALARDDVAPLDQRTPMLSVGSNASPAQLRHKFLDTGVSLVMPLVEATVEGLAAGLAPDVSRYGTVPGTPIVGPDLVDTLFVQWLDARQLAVIDATEVGYDRVLLPAGDPSDGGVRIRLPSGEVLDACDAYVSTRGVLAAPPPAEIGRSAPTTVLVDSVPLWRLPREGPPLTTGGGHDRQGALLSALLDGSARLRQLVGDRDGWYRRAGQPGLADQVRRVFQAEGWVRQQSHLFQY